MTLRNKFIMAPLKLGYCKGDGQVNEKHINFYEARSNHVGAVCLEPLFLDSGLREIPTQLGIDNDDKIPGLKKLTDMIHKKGAEVIAHLNHPGRMANPKIPGNYFISSTGKPCENGGAVPTPMNNASMEQVTELFVNSSIRAESAGFDILELQFGHGYLFSQFLSPGVNDRNDEYSGSFENRASFPIQILDEVMRSVSLPIIVRISGEEMTPNGIKIDESVKLVKILKGKGVDAVHVSAGTVCSTPPWYFQHMFTKKSKTWEFAGTIRKETSMPVVFVGRINSTDDIDLLQNEYNAEYIALGRALIADPDFVGKYIRKKNENIRPCLACSEGCLGGVKSGEGLGCVVNPVLNNDTPQFSIAKMKKHFAVIGAGLSGMETAITLKSRGHDVAIYEKNEIGGQFNLAWLPPHKESLLDIIKYYSNELKRLNIDIYKKEAKASDLLDSNYDGVILATGSVPSIPPVKGLTEYYWAEFLLDKNIPKNKKVVVVGGGLIGVEIASKLIDKENEVIIVEMLNEIANGMEMIEKAMTLKKFKQKNLITFTNSKVESIENKDVVISGEEQQTIKDVDHIVIATGMKSFAPLFDKLKNKIPVYLVGDAMKVGKAQDAIREGYILGLKL